MASWGCSIRKADYGQTGMVHQGFSAVETVYGSDGERSDSRTRPVEAGPDVEIEGDELGRGR